MIQILNKNKYIEILYGLGLFLLAMPYFMWNTGKMSVYLSCILLIISIFNLKKIGDFKLFELLLLPILFFLILYRSREANIYGFIPNLLPIIFFLIKKEKLLSYYSLFKKLFAISIFISLIVYIVVVVFSISIDYKYIEPLNHFKDYNYKQYPFLVVPNSFSEDPSHLFRFHGIFDEPGVVGTFAAIMLVVEKFNLKSPSNIVILLGGLASMSFFFIILCVFFFFYYLNVKYWFVLIGSVLVLFFLTKDDPILYTTVWSRFEIEDGKIKGNNRTSEDLDIYYSSFLNSSNLLWGEGQNFMNKYDDGASASYKIMVIDNGLLFTVLCFMFFTFFAINCINGIRYKLIFLILFYTLMYQRPFLFDPIYFFLLVGAMFALQHKSLEFTNENEVETVLNIGLNKMIY